MSEVDTKVPKEVQEMRHALSAVRKQVRGVKESARGLRAIPRKSDRFSQMTADAMERYDAENPPSDPGEDTTRRTR